MPLSMTVEALDLEDVFPFLFDGIDIGTCCRGVVTTTLFLAPSTPRISLIVLVFLAILAPVGKRLLVLVTGYVSKNSISRLSLFRVFFLLLHRPVLLETL